MDFLYKPQDDVSYDFIASMYSIGMIIGVILAVLDLGFHIEEVKGFWIIFAPFSICLIWAVVMRSLVKKNTVSNKKKED